LSNKNEALQARLKALKMAAKDGGLKLTHQRLEVFKEIAMRGDHPDAEAIYSALKSRLPAISLDTVYRTLWTLTDLGMIATLGPRRERQRFDGNLEKHHHFICIRCGTVRDFESDELDSLRLPSEIGEFGKVIEAQVEVRGICADCARKEVDKANQDR
jgi:Fur family transcriptional regulator, peroxide stress response regulator